MNFKHKILRTPELSIMLENAKWFPKWNKISADFTFHVPFLRPILSYKCQMHEYLRQSSVINVSDFLINCTSILYKNIMNLFQDDRAILMTENLIYKQSFDCWWRFWLLMTAFDCWYWKSLLMTAYDRLWLVMTEQGPRSEFQLTGAKNWWLVNGGQTKETFWS